MTTESGYSDLNEIKSDFSEIYTDRDPREYFRVLGQLDGTVPVERTRVGLAALERVPVREHTELRDPQGHRIGQITSGLPGPTVAKPVAMGYLPPAFASPGTRVAAIVRGRAVPMEVTPLPFVANRYHRG